MFKRLAENIDELSQKNNKVKLNEFNAEEMEPLIVVIITPLMMRVHEMVS